LVYFILFAVLSYLLALQLNFTFVVGEIYFWLYLSLIIIIYSCHSCVGRNPEPAESNFLTNNKLLGKLVQFNPEFAVGDDKKKGMDIKLFIKFTKMILVIGLAVIIYILINNQIKLLTADYYFMQLRESRLSNQYFSAIKMYEFIKEDIKKYGVYDRQFVGIMSPWLDEFDNPGFKKYGEEKLAQILPQIKSDNYDDIYTRAKIYKTLANDNNKEFFNLAEAELKKLISVSPELPNNYFELAGLYFKKTDYDRAILTYQTELTKLPDLANPYLNTDHKQIIENEMYKIYTGIGDSYLMKKNYIEAEKSYLNIFNIDEKFYAAFASLAKLYNLKGDLNKAIWYNEKGMEVEPKNYIWPMNLANIYKEKGDKKQSGEFMKKAQELAPDKF
jgi:tetratricopeptide (TPR) repeat protein